jgi:hypothetical protein
MKESTHGNARQQGGLSSLFAGFMRRKRMIVTLLAITGSFLLLNHYQPNGMLGWLEGEPDSSFDEFQVRWRTRLDVT